MFSNPQYSVCTFAAKTGKLLYARLTIGLMFHQERTPLKISDACERLSKIAVCKRSLVKDKLSQKGKILTCIVQTTNKRTCSATNTLVLPV